MYKEIFVSLWNQLSTKRKFQFYCLVLLSSLSSVFEVFSIGSIIPFVSVIIDPSILFNNSIINGLVLTFGIHSPNELVLPVLVFFMLFVFISGVMRLSLSYFQSLYSFSIGVEFGVKIFNNALYDSYDNYIKSHSSELLSGIQKSSSLVNNAIYPLIIIINSSIILLFVFISLLFYDFQTTIFVFISFSFIYLFLWFLSENKLEANSLVISNQIFKINKIVQEAHGGFRDMILDSLQNIYSNDFKHAYKEYNLATSRNQVIGSLPRLGVETVGIILISLLAYIRVKDGNDRNQFLPYLAVLVLTIQRMLPLVQNIFLAVVTIKGGKHLVKDAIALLKKTCVHSKSSISFERLSFKETFGVRNINYKYTSESLFILRDLSFNIKRGMTVGILGASGSGKSTFLDIIMGLLTPTDGHIFFDHNILDQKFVSAWQRNIAHVPQSIYISSTSIAENIAFGIPMSEIDFQRVKKASSIAQIGGFIEKLPKAYYTQVGERGINFSGGQLQRIGIARALYKNAPILILDEATSALDENTERLLVQSISDNCPGLTIIIVTHRKAALKNCSIVYELREGTLQLVSDGTFLNN
jgi:ATP-binding cassette subfamily B protein